MEDIFKKAMAFRHATKEFDSSKKISDKDFNEILYFGRMSPSSFGLEPWKFLVIQNKDLRNKLKEFTFGGQGQIPTASHFVIILARKKESMIYNSKYMNDMIDRMGLPSDIRAQIYEMVKAYQTDTGLLENDKFIFDWSGKQTYLALSNMMTGAASIGIDSCPIEGFDLRSTEKFLKEDLKVDTENFGASVMVAFGYRKNEPSQKIRHDINDISKWYK